MTRTDVGTIEDLHASAVKACGLQDFGSDDDNYLEALGVLLDSYQREADLTELDEDDAREMLADAGLEESGLDQLARVGYDTLGLSTFLTAGEKEVRAWQIHKGYTAPQAAGVIHTDFEKGFIKADIVSYDDFVAAEGSMTKIKEEGKLRQEGRDYVMADGDIVEFKFNISK